MEDAMSGGGESKWGRVPAKNLGISGRRLLQGVGRHSDVGVGEAHVERQDGGQRQCVGDGAVVYVKSAGNLLGQALRLLAL